MHIQIFSSGGLFVPSKSLGDFVRSNFAILDFFETDIVALSLTAKTSATYVLHRYGPYSDLSCVNYLDWGFNFATKIIVNIFFNDKQRLSRDIVRNKVLPVL